jgi:hypothetical protein
MGRGGLEAQGRVSNSITPLSRFDHGRFESRTPGYRVTLRRERRSQVRRPAATPEIHLEVQDDAGHGRV